jgi:glycosyltransferase involved in cell wall biosynthesis
MYEEGFRRMLIYVVVGSLGSTLIISKMIPIVQLRQVDKLLLFCEKQEVNIPKCEYSRLKLPVKRTKHPLNTVCRVIGTFINLFVKSLIHPPDLIYGIYPLPYGFDSFLVAKLIGKPVAVGVIGDQIQIQTVFPFRKIWKAVNLWYLRRSELVITTGSKVSNYLIENGVRPERIYALPGAIDTDIFTPTERKLRDIDLLFVGRFLPTKGPDVFIEIFSRLKTKYPQLRAVLLGDGILKKPVRELIEQRGLTEWIELPGQVTNVSDYGKRSKIFLLPTKTEGLSVAMMEAMASGVVPVVPDVGNLTDGAKHNTNALVIEKYDDIEGYVKAIDSILADDRKWQRLSQNAIAFARENWSYTAESVRWGKVLDFISKDGRK